MSDYSDCLRPRQATCSVSVATGGGILLPRRSGQESLENRKARRAWQWCPNVVPKLAKLGFEVVVEKDAGALTR